MKFNSKIINKYSDQINMIGFFSQKDLKKSRKQNFEK